MIAKHTPIPVLEQPNAAKIITVLDAVLAYFKAPNIDEFVRFHSPVLSNLNGLMPLLDDLGYLPYADFFNRGSIECLILNSYLINKYKGTEKGIKKLIECISQGTVEFVETDLYYTPNYLIPDDIKYGFLMLSSSDNTLNNLDYAKYPVKNSSNEKFLYLFDSNVTTLPEQSFAIRITGSPYDMKLLRPYLINLLPAYTAYAGGTLKITIL
jgi:hypothetical protein